MVRGIDHLVLPVASLDVARKRYEALGFHVNADGIHPFGTANCCIFFENNTFLEPLAIHDADQITANLGRNSFVTLDHRYRAQMGDDGFSAISLQTEDPQKDEAQFKEAGCAGPSMLSFKRVAKHADGSEDVLSVDGAFCVRDDIPTAAFFTCCWLGNPSTVSKIKQAGDHINAVTGVVGVSLTATDIDLALSYLEIALGGALIADGRGRYVLDLPNGRLDLTGIGADDAHGLDNTPLFAHAFTLASSNLEQTRRVLLEGNVSFEMDNDCIKVPAVAGQGAVIYFRQES